MAKKNEAEVKGQSNEGAVHDLNDLWTMQFRDPVSGEITMVRKAFKPRGKLELYHPEKK